MGSGAEGDSDDKALYVNSTNQQVYVLNLIIVYAAHYRTL